MDIRAVNNISEKEKELDKKLRPLTFEDFNGQKKLRENLEVFVKAAKL
ncbi:MAG: Holliday junction branch migration DNA helicase RuvB, partial [Bacteroidales bacterium]|nr:Holliday junction branch migration DNA helicase RuvB [Bacteroidales bacterium]